MTLPTQITATIDPEWIAAETIRLINIPSVTMDEAAVCVCFGQQLRDLGLDVDIREVTPGRNNLYARIPGTGDGPGLIFNGHLDTIPIGDHAPPYREGDRLYGRGSTDMKGGMAAMLGAARALLHSDVQLQGDVWLTAVVGHEEVEANKDGPKALIEDINTGRIGGDRIIIVEGRDALWVMSMGSMVFTITLTSDKGGMHTQYVPFSENPIRYVGELIQCIYNRQQELDAEAVHPLAGVERIDIGEVNAGDYFNRTPVQCTLTGTRRWSAGKTASDILADIERITAPIAKAGNLTLDITMEHEREPFETPIQDPAVQTAAAAHRQVTGQEAEYVGRRIVGDANLYVHGCGIPTFYYGPSNETAHANVEWVSVDRAASAAAVYALTAMNYCGQAW
ncbi:MAG: M20/M25/M40 family metallo-hydrolase [Candidatus Latescibacteria bacterium]|jgi:acetylornithine deacetylase/succinyl-diaminopimelate desuccinylase-like protein|nr:M20/M25/M40 family metallo-hydrolase [Candidatus Latescibacterota bacterium]MDP7237150.1 M20/M25/M40 family metallo-hydrolase [Candidatus Latescibacterota bacterium]